MEMMETENGNENMENIAKLQRSHAYLIASTRVICDRDLFFLLSMLQQRLQVLFLLKIAALLIFQWSDL